jgi:2-polyprenyl-3-methyl-5-hydroxy-6-metoxy-1,4-benzoquinol methylase
MEHIACPLCLADRSKLIFLRRDFAHPVSEEDFRVVRCRVCGLVYLNPRPTEEEIHSYYPEEFYQPQLDAEQLLREKEHQLFLKYEYVKNIPPGRLLDIGCMKGEFLYFMQQHGWEVHGIEFSTKPPNVFGLDIHYGDLFSARYAAHSFDLITLWAVLEHVYYPRKMLTEACRLLKPGGRVVLLVTNFHSLPARLMRHDDIPRHTTLFTKRTLGKMLRICGLIPTSYRFNCRLFGGNNRGVLNYLFKLLAGERISEIVAQNRTVSRWQEFSSMLRGKPSSWMLKVDEKDRHFSPIIDRWMDRLHFGFIMIATAKKKSPS